MRPARISFAPGFHRVLHGAAMRTGFFAAAIAVFISTPSQPSSMAMAASEAVPTPASTSTGTFACSMMS